MARQERTPPCRASKLAVLGRAKIRGTRTIHSRLPTETKEV